MMFSRITPGGKGLSIAVVVILTGILIAVLMPALHDAQVDPNTDKWVQHLRQIQMSSLGYSGDNDDRLPLANAWMDSLSPYLGVRFGPTYIPPDASNDPVVVFCDPRSSCASGGTAFGDTFNSALSSQLAAEEGAVDILVCGVRGASWNAHEILDAKRRPPLSEMIMISDGGQLLRWLPGEAPHSLQD